MAWNDLPGNKDKKNPWGGPPPSRDKDSGQGGGGGDMPPDLDDMLRRAQANFRQVMPGGAKDGKVVVLVACAAVAFWLASGLYTVMPGESAVVQRFGAWSNTQTGEGLHYRLPWPVETVEKINVSEVRRLPVGFIEGQGRSGTSLKQDVPEESLMLTSDANIVNLDLVVLWNIKSAEDFLFNIQDQEGTIKKVAESAIREVVGQTPMFTLITDGRDAVAQRAREIMIKNLDQYKSGVNISQVLIQAAEVHPDVQEAFQDVQSAKQDAFDSQNRAETYRQDILPRARGEAIRMTQDSQGYRLSVVERAKGDAQRFDSIYDSYKTAPDVTRTRLYIETMEAVMQNADKTIIDDEGKGSGVLPYLSLNEPKKSAATKEPEKSALPDSDVKASGAQP